MNIVITLSKDIITEIIDERRWILIYRFVPNRYNIDEDVVLVVEKGTKNIPVLFSIKRFVISGNVAVRFNLLNDSLLKDGRICIWEIGRVCSLKYPDNAALRIGLKNNPASFCYNGYDVAQFNLGKSFWGLRVNGGEKSYIFAPDRRNKVIQEYLASDSEVDFLQWCEDNKIPYNWRGCQLK